MSYITVYDDDPDSGLPGYRTYESLCFTGPGAISLVGTMAQRRHPNDTAREHRADIGEAKDAQSATRSNRPKRLKCEHGHWHWGTVCQKCLPEVWCPCGRRVFSAGETQCWLCRERGHRRTGFVEAQA